MLNIVAIHLASLAGMGIWIIKAKAAALMIQGKVELRSE
jgi:hypothetical protein